MKPRRWLNWCFWSFMALWTTWSYEGSEKADVLFDCIYNQFCHKRTFEFVRSCWLILATETKEVIQTCTKSHCQLELPEFYSKEDLCGGSISYSKKKECLYVCLQKLADYIEKLERQASFSYISAYHSLIHAKDCFSPFLKVCL